MFTMPGGIEWMVILAVGLLLFGRRLPEVGRSVGRTIVEFKRGMREADKPVNPPVAPRSLTPEREPQALPPRPAESAH